MYKPNLNLGVKNSGTACFDVNLVSFNVFLTKILEACDVIYISFSDRAQMTKTITLMSSEDQHTHTQT